MAARAERMQTWRRCLELQRRVFRLLGDNRRHLGSKQAKSAWQQPHAAQQLLVYVWGDVLMCVSIKYDTYVARDLL